MKDRVVGSLVGLAVGDALGTTIEFTVRDSTDAVVDIVGGGPFNLNAGEWTDDTSMALCLAESLIASPNLDETDLLQLFNNWYQHGYNSVKDHCFDIGWTTSSGIRSWCETGSVVNNQDSHCAGNGGIMRLAPAAMIAWRNSDVASDLSVRQSKTTHASAQCCHSADFMARWLVNLYSGDLTRPYSDQWDPAVQTIATIDYTQVSRSNISSSGYVIHTLEAAVWAVLTSSSFEEAVLKAVNLGDDADTVGAVAGQFAGARWGLSSIPQHWVDRIYDKDRIVQLSEQLYRIG